MYASEDPEPSGAGEAGQDLKMELGYQNLHVYIVCVPAKMCQCVHVVILRGHPESITP